MPRLPEKICVSPSPAEEFATAQKTQLRFGKTPNSDTHIERSGSPLFTIHSTFTFVHLLAHRLRSWWLVLPLLEPVAQPGRWATARLRAQIYAGMLAWAGKEDVPEALRMSNLSCGYGNTNK